MIEQHFYDIMKEVELNIILINYNNLKIEIHATL